jgi:hypothetical protein
LFRPRPAGGLLGNLLQGFDCRHGGLHSFSIRPRGPGHPCDV